MRRARNLCDPRWGALGAPPGKKEPLPINVVNLCTPLVACHASREDASVVRSAIFTLTGAVLLMIATFSYGMVFLDGAMQQSAFQLVIGGTLVGGFLGFLVAELTRPSGIRRTRLTVLGAVGGLLAGLVYGVIALECPPGSDTGACGWVFLGRLFQYPWMPIALWAVFGGFVGAFLGWTSARLARRWKPAPAASVGRAAE
jgi:hypothetical protein